jgi:hypothetical protein
VNVETNPRLRYYKCLSIASANIRTRTCDVSNSCYVPFTLPAILKYHKSTSAPMHDAWFWKVINAIFLTFKIVELGHILTTMDIQSMQRVLNKTIKMHCILIIVCKFTINNRWKIKLKHYFRQL